MPSRERFRGESGRIISAAQAENLARFFHEIVDKAGRTIVSTERAGTPPPPPVEWYITPTDRSEILTAGGEVLPDDALNIYPPSDAVSFQVRFIVPASSRYPRAWASYRTLAISEWSHIHDVVRQGEHIGATGVGAIVFHRGA